MFNNGEAIYIYIYVCVCVSKFRMDDAILTPKKVALILLLF